jgi:hypothetical protein
MFIVDVDDVIFDTTNQLLKYYEITPPEGKYDRAEIFKDATDPLPLNFWEMLPLTPFADIIISMLIIEKGFFVDRVTCKFEAVCKFARILETTEYHFIYAPMDQPIYRHIDSTGGMLLTTSEEEVANWNGDYFLIPAPWNSAKGDVLEVLHDLVKSRTAMFRHMNKEKGK